jgi:peptidoglycan/xylan/chitin deacetylase (PgdA/CDA1 family)
MPSGNPLGLQHRYATHSSEGSHRPSGFKARLRSLSRSCLLAMLATVQRPRPGSTFLRLLYAHFVFDDQRQSFAAVIRRLRELGEFVTTDAAVQMAAGAVSIDGRYFHLSFDDGLQNVLSNAAPILDEEEVPFITFVNSAFAEASFEEIVQLSRQNDEYPAPVKRLTWNDMRCLCDRGFEIGSHTRTHARLSGLQAEPDRLRSEVLGSKLDIERELGRPCRYFACPYGEADDAAIMAAVADAGYEAAFAIGRAPVVVGSTSPFAIPRNHFEADWPLWQVEYFASGGADRLGRWRR